ncbi:hypothetical protein FAM22279_01084 [Lacticaseibacillus paracasei]|uniref:hypothetical protein n=1 Tax=Lacticaseibacillus paracasei TaxID=1597 RepID=UPI000F0BABC5|nr:hypothetical protein [Lacticaseibacillus paracasei]MDM7527050.1 hypothetical protein [Lacticaseibacillus paracasei]RND45727.1 hypothetical protein FAM18110_02358 [Lacticaseibacillus paracasei]RNE10012.1 hypothetical protein FAM22279_01084 [Lacticaseibacillus paracasei]
MSEHSSQWYRDQTNQLIQSLSKNDQQYFEDLQLYLVTKKAFSRDELAIQKSLYTMAQDLVDASKDGISASNFFGKKPKKMADEMLTQMPKISLRERLELIGIVVGISWLYLFLSGGNGRDDQAMILNPWKYLGVAFIEGICLALILWIVNFYTVSTTHRSWKRFSAGVLMALVFAGGAAAWIWLEEIPSQFGIKILYPWDVGLIVLITILGALYFWVKMPSEFRLIALVTVVMGIGVILQRLAYAGVVVYTKMGRVIFAVAVVMTIVILVVWNIYIVRNKESS